MRSSMHRRTAVSGESQLQTAESLIRMGHMVCFFARKSLYEGFRISFSFSQPFGKA